MVSSCLCSRPEFRRISEDIWGIKAQVLQKNENPQEIKQKMRLKQEAMRKKQENKKKRRKERPERAFDLEVGQNVQDELQYIVLAKRQQYSDVYDSLNACLKEAEARQGESDKIGFLSDVRFFEKNSPIPCFSCLLLESRF